MKAVLKKSGIATRQQRLSVQGHPALFPEWLLALASQYLHAYQNLPNPARLAQPYWPKYLLLGHSVELVLKEFLARKGVTEAKLKKLKHNIRPLLKQASALGLALPPKRARIVGSARRYPR